MRVQVLALHFHGLGSQGGHARRLGAAPLSEGMELPSIEGCVLQCESVYLMKVCA